MLYTREELGQADEVFMTNVGLLVSSIASIEPIGYKAKATPYTETFRAMIEDDVRNT